MPSRSKLAVILHADVVGSTALVQKNESIAHDRIQDAFRRFSSVIHSYGGTTHELRGDALVAGFENASDAVSASLAFQQLNTGQNSQFRDDIVPEVRIGIAAGEVVIADNTVTGEGVVLAQRIEQFAEPAGICIQGAVSEIIPRRLPFNYRSLGDKSLKGFKEPVRILAVSLKPGSEMLAPNPSQVVGESSTSPSEKPSIAVLPLVNMSGDEEQEYFSEGLTEDIITELSRFHDLHVISRNSTFVFQNKAIDAREIGRNLNARYLVEGSVRKSANRIRITIQLIDTRTGHHLWAERYNRELEDIFEVQDEITELIVSTLAVKVESDALEQSIRKKPESLETYDYVLRGETRLMVYSKEASTQAKEQFLKAIDIDPGYARAYAGLAFSYLSDWGFLLGAPLSCMDRAVEYARKAVELDESESRSHWVLAYVLTFNKQYDEARAHQIKAVWLNPNDADVLAKMGYILPLLGEHNEAIELAEKATRLNPYYPDWYNTFLGFTYFTAKRYEEAIATFKASGNVYPGDYAWMAAAYAHMGNIDEARSVMDSFLKEAGPNPWWREILHSAEVVDRDPTGLLTYMTFMYPFKNSSDLEHLLTGLRMAGVPE